MGRPPSSKGLVKFSTALVGYAPASAIITLGITNGTSSGFVTTTAERSDAALPAAPYTSTILQCVKIYGNHIPSKWNTFRTEAAFCAVASFDYTKITEYG